MNTERFREQVRSYRAPTCKTQEDLAKVLGLNPQVLSHKLHRIRNTRLTHCEVKAIVKTLVEWGAMSKQAQAHELLELMECPDFSPAEWQVPPLNRLEAAASTYSVHWQNLRIPVVEYEVSTQGGSAPPSIVLGQERDAGAYQLPRQDWGEAMDVSAFYGREQELVELERWIVDDHCRLVALLSMGGLGKTALSVKLTQQVARHFNFVIWHSLQNAPPLENLLAECITFLSEQQKTDLPENVGERITLLLHYLRKARCLLVLDNVETILQERDRVGHYRAGYEAYGNLFQQGGQADHRSCLLLTSREKPKELAPLEGKRLPVRTMMLTGLEQSACRQLLYEHDVFGTEQACHDLIARYDGNPLALKLVASTIREVFGGNIAAFLNEGEVLFGDIRDVLDQQFERLSTLEKIILGWLALAREWVTFTDLVEESVCLVSRKKLLEALEALRRRCLLERGEAGALFTLHPLVMEYVTERVVEQVAQEITSGHLKLLLSHSLMKAQTKEHVRDSQIQLTLKPVLERLLIRLKSEHVIEQQLMHVLATLRNTPRWEHGYGSGNVINLLYQLRGTLRGSDFSGLHIRQASFVGVDLQDANFAGSSFAKCVFSETFSSIFSVTFSPDGQLLAAGSLNGEVRVWQLADYRQLLDLCGHKGWVWSVTFSSDGAYLASGGEDRIVRIWEVGKGQCLTTLHGHTDWIRSVAFSPDDSLLASSSDDGTVRLWEVSTGACLTTFQGHTDRVMSVAFSPDGARLASGSDDRMVRVWSVSSGHCFETLQGHTGRVWSVTFSPDGACLASGSYDTTVRLWEVSTGMCLKTLQGHANWMGLMTLSPDGSLLASGNHDRTVRLWEVHTGACLKTLQGHTDWVRSVAFSPDGTLLASGCYDRTVRLWEVSSGQCLKTLQGHTDGVRSVAFSPDRSRLASGSYDTTVRLWEVSTGKCLKTLRGHTNWTDYLAFSPDGTLLASGNHDRTVRLWEVRTGKCLKILQGHTDWVESVAFSPDGSLLASGGHNGKVSLWDVSSGACLRTLHSHSSRVWAVAFSLDGSTVVSASEDRTIILWNIRTGERLNMVRNRLYERMNITGISGLTGAQKATLRELGAVEERASSSHAEVLQEGSTVKATFAGSLNGHS
ncbi:MAG: hypothetical protein E6I80_06520 [Chloroflexi bacterium]|nr:MAG: hypothetical protein E6I80_06520 [Chloroflexota bacterium]